MSAPAPALGVGMRRKGPKSLPRLPLSAFTPPNTGTSDRFPIPPTPSNVHPSTIIDAHVVPVRNVDLSQWKQEIGQTTGGKIGSRISSAVLSLPDAEQSTIARLESSTDPILSVMIPMKLDSPLPPKLPTSKLPISLSVTYSKPHPNALPALRWALENGRVVDLSILCDATQEDAQWEGLEDLLTKATADLPKPTPIVLSNLLPPPNGLQLPIVKFMNHPTYHAYQAHVAALSLFPNLYVKFLPPNWGASVPQPAPAHGWLLSPQEPENKDVVEWKRRIRMYIGPMLEAFGYERIIFGTSPASSSPSPSHAGDWYEIARELLAELALEQAAIDSVFSGNAKAVYGQ